MSQFDKTLVTNINKIEPKRERHGTFEYAKYLVLPKAGNQCTIAFMEVAPGKSAFPYHYHIGITEVFFIISGEGIIITPDGESPVKSGDVIAFPPGEAGTHRIVNTSKSEILRYLDVDTVSEPDVAFYPDSGKVGLILGGKPHSVYRRVAAVDYYEGENGNDEGKK